MNICKKCGNNFKPIKGLINYCSLNCRNSRIWSTEDKEKKSNSAINSNKVKIANKIIGQILKEKADAWITKICPICNIEFKTRKNINSNYHRLCWNKISGGYRQGSTRGKSGWYKGYWCDSSWELAWVIYHLEHDIKFERNIEGFDYEYQNKKYKYYPDFIINGQYQEIKNYISNQVKAKTKAFPKPLKIWLKEDLKEIFEYVQNSYGKDYIKLYEIRLGA